MMPEAMNYGLDKIPQLLADRADDIAREAADAAKLAAKDAELAHLTAERDLSRASEAALRQIINDCAAALGTGIIGELTMQIQMVLTRLRKERDDALSKLAAEERRVGRVRALQRFDVRVAPVVVFAHLLDRALADEPKENADAPTK